MFVEAMSPDKSLGSAMKKFSAFMTDVERTYPQLKQKHKDNIGILQKEFGYHPAYKTGRNPNEFSSAYHTMYVVATTARVVRTVAPKGGLLRSARAQASVC